MQETCSQIMNSALFLESVRDFIVATETDPNPLALKESVRVASINSSNW